MFVRVLALLLCVLACSIARADGALESARDHFRAGLAHAESGAWVEALRSFSAAYELAPRARVLFNLAAAQLRCGKLLAANTNYRRVLATAGDALSSAQRAAATRQVAYIEERIPRLSVRIEGLALEDRLLLDGQRLYPDELERDIWVDPGAHQLVVYRAGNRPELRTLEIAEGERRVLLMSLASRL